MTDTVCKKEGYGRENYMLTKIIMNLMAKQTLK
jgi:hypothetical protein